MHLVFTVTYVDIFNIYHLSVIIIKALYEFQLLVGINCSKFEGPLMRNMMSGVLICIKHITKKTD